MLLIIHKTKRIAERVADSYFFMGQLALGVTPSESLSEISGIHKAIVIIRPEELFDAEDFVARLRSYKRDIPIFALSDNESYFGNLFDLVLPCSTSSPRLYQKMREYISDLSLPLPGEYKLSGINASVDLPFSFAFDKKLPFTKTENMIVRTLISLYPTPIDSKLILKYALRATRLPDVSSIRTHISVINRKFRNISGNNLITMLKGRGYIIATPEITEYKKTSEMITSYIN